MESTAMEKRIPPRQQVTAKFPVVGERQPSPEALDLSTWRLAVSGEVTHPRTWTYAEFLELPQVSVTCDIHCVTRWSKLDCTWEGVRFSTIAEIVKPLPTARFVQFIAYSSRDHDTSLPLELCQQEVLFAHSMNGAPLSIEHGYPLRTVTPSRYFYKSLKWVREVRFLPEDVLGYWERGGYHNHADYWKEERYVSGNLSPQQVAQLRETGDFRRYAGQVLLSLDLHGADFSGRDLTGVALKHCNLTGVNFAGANLQGANFTNSDLRYANLYRANLDDGDLDGTLLMGADLRYCSMRRVTLSAAEFCRPGEPEALVEGLDLTGAYLDGLLEEQWAF
ncbi:MAG: nitrate reductase, partial [Nitrospinota bacterium]